VGNCLNVATKGEPSEGEWIINYFRGLLEKRADLLLADVVRPEGRTGVELSNRGPGKSISSTEGANDGGGNGRFMSTGRRHNVPSQRVSRVRVKGTDISEKQQKES